MFGIVRIGKKLIEKLRRPSYRHGYVSEHVRRGIAHQIRALRDQRGWNQGQFSKRLGKPQSVVSRLEDPSYGKVTIQTLLEVAKTFDVALQIRFVPFSSFLLQTRDVSNESMNVESFEGEINRSSNSLTIKPLEEVLLTGDVPQFDWDSGELLPRVMARSDAMKLEAVSLQ